MSELDEGQTERDRLREEIQTRVRDFLHTYEGFDEDILSAWYLVAEVVKPDGARTILELSDTESSKFTAMGLLYAALTDDRW